MDDDFKIGNQPCTKFEAQKDYYYDSVGSNRHQCYKCAGVVSFCINCNKDHHENGYESCLKDIKIK